MSQDTRIKNRKKSNRKNDNKKKKVLDLDSKIWKAFTAF